MWHKWCQVDLTKRVALCWSYGVVEEVYDKKASLNKRPVTGL